MDQQRENPPPAREINSVGRRIKLLREERELSLSRLADAAGVSKGYLHDLENSSNGKPSAAILYNIALALDTTVAYLLGRQTNPLENGSRNEPPVIPESLEQFARQARIPEEDKRRLACIKYRGAQPKTAEDWAYLYETIRRVVEGR